MPASKYVLLLIFSCILSAGFSQSIYRLDYNFHSSDTTSYQGLLTIYQSGGGIARTRYTDPVTKEMILIESDVEEKPVIDQSGMPDANRTVYNYINSRLISGNTEKVSFTPPMITFSYDTNSGYLEPSSIADDKGVTITHTGFTASLVDDIRANRELFSMFYNYTDDIFLKLFGTKSTRGNSIDKSTRLLLLVVTNTNEKTIGAACAFDKARCLQTFQAFSDYLGIKMIADTIAGNIYSKKNVQQAINRLKPVPNKDIVVFYYSGHGFRKDNDNRAYPYIDLRAKPSDNYLTETMNMEDIFNTIRKKGARLNLILSDCCNTTVEASTIEAPKPAGTRGSRIEMNMDNCIKLFMDKKPTSILATAAESGQRASCNRNLGGFFSYFLSQNMEEYGSDLRDDPSWQKILDDTKVLTTNKAKLTYCDKPYVPANICKQYPEYMIK